MTTVNENYDDDDKNKQLNKYDELKSWDDLEINTDLLRGIYAYGFEGPSPIQKKAIVPVIKGHDIIAQAQATVL